MAQANKTLLKDPSSGEALYPVTSSACVGMSDGSGNLDTKLTELSDNVGLYNVDKNVPLGSGFYTSTTARNAVPSSVRKLGLIITYKTDATTSVTEQFIGSSVSAWSTDTNWKNVGSEGGNKILEWNTDVATTRKQVRSNSRKAGMQISYTPDGKNWVNEQYVGESFTDKEWGKDTNWNSIVTKKRVTKIRNVFPSVSFDSIVIDFSSGSAYTLYTYAVLYFQVGLLYIKDIIYKAPSGVEKATISFCEINDDGYISQTGEEEEIQLKDEWIDTDLGERVYRIPYNRAVDKLIAFKKFVFTRDSVNGGGYCGSGTNVITPGSGDQNKSIAIGFTILQNSVSPETLAAKQNVLSSGINIKTINGESLLGKGNVEILTDVSLNDIKATVDNNTGTPSVEVSVDDDRNITFSFKNIKGETGKTGGQGPEGPVGPSGVQLGEISLEQTFGTEEGSEKSVISKKTITERLSSVWKGKKVGFLGDSTTADNYYINAYKKLTGCTAINYGLGRSHLANFKSDWKVESFEERMTAMDKELDMVVVFGGTNDFGHSDTADFGTFTDGTSDKLTFYAGLHRMYSYLSLTYRGKPVVIVTPIHHGYEVDTHEYDKLDDGTFTEGINSKTQKTFKEYVNAIKEVAAFYSLPVIDAYSYSGMTPWIESLSDRHYFRDGLHFTQIGGEKFANFLYPFLENMVANSILLE